MCTASTTTSEPMLTVSFEMTITVFRPNVELIPCAGSSVLLSTFRIAFPALLTASRPVDCAVAWSR
jgi:hypothetical protein